jgi:hypothetical protein
LPLDQFEQAILRLHQVHEFVVACLLCEIANAGQHRLARLCGECNAGRKLVDVFSELSELLIDAIVFGKRFQILGPFLDGPTADRFDAERSLDFFDVFGQVNDVRKEVVHVLRDQHEQKREAFAETRYHNRHGTPVVDE